MTTNGRHPDGEEAGPSAAKLREGIIERLRTIPSRNALLAIDAVVSLLEPPYDESMCLEAFLGVAEIVAGQRLMSQTRAEPAELAELEPGEEGEHEPS